MPRLPLHTPSLILLAALLLPACEGPPDGFNSARVEEGRPGEPGHRAAGLWRVGGNADGPPSTPQLPSRLEFANDRTRQAERDRERGN